MPRLQLETKLIYGLAGSLVSSGAVGYMFEYHAACFIQYSHLRVLDSLILDIGIMKQVQPAKIHNQFHEDTKPIVCALDCRLA